MPNSVRAQPAATVLVPPERYPFYFKLLFFVFVLALPALLGNASRAFRDGDVSWHVATGQWILAHRTIPQTDPFSFTMPGRPWVPHEWLADILFGGAFNLSGHSGLAIVLVFALVALNLIVFLHLRPRMGPVGLFLALLALSIGVAPFVLARPHVVVWPLLAAWTVLLVRAAEDGRTPPPWLPLLMALWANLHGSFLLGFAVYGFLALEALVASKWPPRLFTGWALIGAASLAATLLNANGLDGLLHPLAITTMETLPLIEEWKPTSLENSPFFLGLLGFAAAALAVRRPAVPPARAALIVLMLAMALAQVRHQSWLTIVAVLLLAPLFSRGRTAQTPLFVSRSSRRAWLAALAAVVAGFVAVRLAIPLAPEENEGNPRGLLAAVPERLRQQPVLNGYSFGGPLILHGIRPYIDGRADMYGDAFVKDWRRIVDGDVARFEAAVARYDLQWTMLPAEMEIVRHLDRSPEWRRIYSDEVGTIHVREARGEPRGGSRL